MADDGVAIGMQALAAACLPIDNWRIAICVSQKSAVHNELSRREQEGTGVVLSVSMDALIHLTCIHAPCSYNKNYI